MIVVALPRLAPTLLLAARIALEFSRLKMSIWNVITVSLRQRVTPHRLLGRVNSAYRLLAWGTMPLGAAVGGIVGQVFGLPAVFLGAGAVVLSLLTGMIWVTDRRMDEAESAVAAPSADPVDR